MRLPPRIISVTLIACILGVATADAQSQGVNRPARTVIDTGGASNFDNFLAVVRSGVWEMDGEYKGTRAEYYKLTGYFAYVGATANSDDDGEAAVMAMYLEPMAGGAPVWLSARLRCSLVSQEVRCIAVAGANQLLDLNYVFKRGPFRGTEGEIEITEPEDETAAKRFVGRSTSRGKFKLVRPD